MKMMKLILLFGLLLLINNSKQLNKDEYLINNFQLKILNDDELVTKFNIFGEFFLIHFKREISKNNHKNDAVYTLDDNNIIKKEDMIDIKGDFNSFYVQNNGQSYATLITTNYTSSKHLNRYQIVNSF
jgi:hypothetical protein